MPAWGPLSLGGAGVWVGVGVSGWIGWLAGVVVVGWVGVVVLIVGKTSDSLVGLVDWCGHRLLLLLHGLGVLGSECICRWLVW